MSDGQLVSYRVWDAPTRVFHWINALAVLGLILVGTLILFSGSLGVSPSGKVAIKTIHVWIGYAMVLNLLWRFVWAFLGNRYARWKAILPGGPGYLAALEAYVASIVAGHPRRYLGHNPLGRLAVSAILILLVIGRRPDWSWRERTSSIRLSGAGSPDGCGAECRPFHAYPADAGPHGPGGLRGDAVLPVAIRRNA